MKRLLVRLVLPALAAMGASAPASAGKSSLIVVGPGVVVHFGGHRGPVKRHIGPRHVKPGVDRRHGLRHGFVRHGKLHRAEPRRGKAHRAKRLHRKSHLAERRHHDRRPIGLHSRPLSRHFSHGRHRAKVRPHHRTRQFFLGHGVRSPQHGRRFSSGRRVK